MDFKRFDDDTKLVKFIKGDHQSMLNIRALREPLWRNLFSVFQPRSYNFLKEYDDGQQFGKNLYFDYPALCSHKFALGMNGHMISRYDPWVQFIIEDQKKMQSDKVKQYLQDAREVIINSFSQSDSFYTAAYWAAREYGVIGTTIIWPDEDRVDGKMMYKNISIGSVCLRKDHNGKYNGLTQECKITAIDLLDRFGKENLPAEVIKDAEGKGTSDNPFREYDLLIYVSYNSNFIVGTLEPEDMKYKVFYLLHKIKHENEQLIMKSGRATFPIVIGYGDRYDDPYGTSIGAECLNTGLIGNKLVALMLDDANKATKGIWKVSKSIGKLDLRAGSATRIDRADEIIENIYQNKGYQISIEERRELKQTCREWFFLDFFELLSNPDLHQITAYQASRMTGEKVALMSTAIGGFESLLRQSIDIQWDFESNVKRNMPEPPDELFDDNGQDSVAIRPKFIGNLAQLQRSSFKTMGLMDWASAVKTLSDTWPSAKVKVNELELVEQLAIGMGVQEKAVKDDEEVVKVLQAIAEQEAQAAEQEAIMEGAKTIPSLSKKIEAGSPAEFLAGAIG